MEILSFDSKRLHCTLKSKELGYALKGDTDSITGEKKELGKCCMQNETNHNAHRGAKGILSGVM